MTQDCDDMYCSQDYGFKLDETGDLWCETCGKLEATKEELQELTAKELKTLGLLSNN